MNKSDFLTVDAPLLSKRETVVASAGDIVKWWRKHFEKILKPVKNIHICAWGYYGDKKQNRGKAD